MSIINKSLKDRGREPAFRLLYSPNIINLLSLLNTFRRSEKGLFANEEEESIVDLSDVNLLKENVGSLIRRMLDERCDLLSEVSEKVTFLRSSSSVNANIDRVTGLPSDIVDTHKGVVDLQTKMLVVQALFDLYKVISIELHRRVDYKSKYEFHDRGTDFFERCPLCVNGYLMRNEYKTMIDSIRESLPLMNSMNGNFAQSHRDPLRHETISDTKNLSFIEDCSINEEMAFQKTSELARYGLNLDIMPSQFLEYDDFDDRRIRCRSVNNVLNYYHRASVNSPFSLSDIDPRNEYVFKVNAALRRIKSKGNTASPIYLTKEIRNLNQVLQDGRVYYPFRKSNWDDFSRCTISSYFVGIRDESRYQSSDNLGTYGRQSKISTLNEDGDFEFRQDVRAALFDVNDDGEANRQQFDSISKDFLSSMSANFDPQRDSFHDNINVKSYQTFEQKW